MKDNDKLLDDMPDLPSDAEYEAWKKDLKDEGIIDMDDI